MYEYRTLQSSECQQYRAFTFPYFREWLDRVDGDKLAALGVSRLGQPCGLALVEALADSPSSARLHSIFVAPGMRAQGIGSSLLREVREWACVNRIASVEARFLRDTPGYAAVRRFLERNGWNAPVPSMIICHANYEGIRQAPWMRLNVLDREYSLVAWDGLTARNWAELQSATWFPRELGPFVPAWRVIAGASLFLLRNGEVSGWCLMEHFDPQTLCCSRLFVKPELENMGLGIRLLVQSIEAAHALGHDKYCFDTGVDRPRMIRFVQRRMAQYLNSLRVLEQTSMTIPMPQNANEREVQESLVYA
jgi:GNAT superfamily N-acetyltransferase